MLSLLRLRALPLLRLSPRAPGTLSSSLHTPLRTLSFTAPRASAHMTNVCLNCRREGHLRADCKEPTICVACGVEGHQRRDCPTPDPARLEALKTAPLRWCVIHPLLPVVFRCNETGHTLKECTKPQTCYACKQEGHSMNKCPTLASAAAPAPGV
ncbi:hypothetical protein C8R44DRAFT_893654 [Mycena epipterygia]|nr:hypothetical protein C8R44DRAFT_893654 [Mycena epipterygia]